MSIPPTHPPRNGHMEYGVPWIGRVVPSRRGGPWSKTRWGWQIAWILISKDKTTTNKNPTEPHTHNLMPKKIAQSCLLTTKIAQNNLYWPRNSLKGWVVDQHSDSFQDQHLWHPPDPRRNPTSMDVMPWIHWNWNVNVKRHLPLVDFMACWLSSSRWHIIFVASVWKKVNIHFAIFVGQKPRYHPESSRNRDHLLWVASKKPSPSRPDRLRDLPLTVTQLKIDIKHSRFPQFAVWNEKKIGIWPEETESPRDVENSWASS